MGEIFKRPYKVRRAAQRGKEVTIAPEAKMQPRYEVVQRYAGFVLIVPRGAKMNENNLRRAVRMAEDRLEKMVEKRGLNAKP